MEVNVLTTFPEYFDGPLRASILRRAVEAGLLDVRVHNLRDFTDDAHRKTDDEQYGGGEGMVMLAEPVLRAVDHVCESLEERPHTVLLTPAGKPLTQSRAVDLAREDRLILICGHYKGIDERVSLVLQPEELSIGDYVLSGGEIPALVLIDALTRLLPGAVGNRDSVESDSFFTGLLDCPRYTRPRVVRDLPVPGVLLSGNHEQIRKWRYRKALEKTRHVRPDLLQPYNTLESESHPSR